MKKFISVILLFSICISTFTSCSNKDADGIAVQDFCSRYSSNYSGDYQWSYKDLDYNKLYDMDFEDADITKHSGYKTYDFRLYLSFTEPTATMNIETKNKKDDIRKIEVFLGYSVATNMFFSRDDFVNYFSSILLSVNPELDKELLSDKLSSMILSAATSQLNQIVLDHIDNIIFQMAINYDYDLSFIVRL